MPFFISLEMNKQELRKQYLAKRKTLSKNEVEERSIAIANQILKLDIWDYQNYHLFLPIQKQNEVQTDAILNIIMGKDKNVIISKSNFEDFSMTHHLLTDATQLKISKYGIPEPIDPSFNVDEKDIDVVFVPLLAFDHHGHRIGYGKGFYDRFLSKCRPTTKKIGLSFFEPLDHEIPTGDKDLPLDVVVSPYQIFNFK